MASSLDPWESAAGWWLDTIAEDAIFATDVLPLLAALTAGESGPWLDLGCGDGRAHSALPPVAIGCDISAGLLERAAQRGPAVRCCLPDLRWVGEGALGGASLVLVLEHVAELDALLAAVARSVRPGGALVAVVNHPAFTASGAGPVVDPTDGEVLWRWGPYFTPAATTMEVGGREVTFHHRPMGVLLSAAADSGWRLERLEERALSPAATAHEPGYAGQEDTPRLAGIRWRR